MTPDIYHLDDETLQAFLEGELDEPTNLAASAHLADCPACVSRSEEWAALLRELSELPLLEPLHGLGDRVLGLLPSPAPAPAPAAEGFFERFRKVLPAAWARRHGHIRPRAIQDVLDGLAGSAARTQLRAHAAGCAACRTELTAWERMYAALSELGHFAPSPGFHLRVLEQLRALAAAPFAPRRSDLLEGWLAAARGLLPTTRKGWVFATALLAAPALGVVALIAVLLLNPLLTPADLFAFAGWRVQGFLQLASASVMQWLGGAPVPFPEGGPLRAVFASPGLAAVGLGGLWALVSAAGWVIYVHVLAPAIPTRRHAHASS
ncbi:MAG TPA: zf-HC2 domain-containing protein [Vicinamibacteria bacterium]